MNRVDTKNLLELEHKPENPLHERCHFIDGHRNEVGKGEGTFMGAGQRLRAKEAAQSEEFLC